MAEDPPPGADAVVTNGQNGDDLDTIVLLETTIRTDTSIPIAAAPKTPEKSAENGRFRSGWGGVFL